MFGSEFISLILTHSKCPIGIQKRASLLLKEGKMVNGEETAILEAKGKESKLLE